MKLDLTSDQAKALLNILDIAVRAGGLQLASTVLFFQDAIQKAEQAEKLVNPGSPTNDGPG